MNSLLDLPRFYYSLLTIFVVSFRNFSFQVQPLFLQGFLFKEYISLQWLMKVVNLEVKPLIVSKRFCFYKIFSFYYICSK